MRVPFPWTAVALTMFTATITLVACGDVQSREIESTEIEFYIEQVRPALSDMEGLTYRMENLRASDDLADIEPPAGMSGAHALLQASYENHVMSQVLLWREAKEYGDTLPACGGLDFNMEYWLSCEQADTAEGLYAAALTNWAEDLASACGIPFDLTNLFSVVAQLPNSLPVIDDCLDG